MTKSRNPELGTTGVRRFGKSAAAKAQGQWRKKQAAWKPTQAAAAASVAPKTKQFGKAGKRVIAAKLAKAYPAEDVPKPLQSRAASRKAVPKLRANITPGTVLILLAGRFRGRKVVFLKQLASGLLLVTGPYAINGVPFRRVSQRYVIATSVKVDVSGVKVPDNVNDAFFKKAAAKKSAKTEATFFEGGDKAKAEQKREKNPERVALQKSFDAAVVAAVKKVDKLQDYLKVTFSLGRGDFPHAMKF